MGALAHQQCQFAKDFLAPRLEAIASLGDQQVVPRNGVRKEKRKETLLDMAKSLQKRVPLTKLVEMDASIRPYLTALLVAAA